MAEPLNFGDYHLITADQLHIDRDEDGILTLAFAEGLAPDPENYLILQCGGEDNELGHCYFEICSREHAGYDGFASWQLHERQIFLTFRSEIADAFDCPGLLVQLADGGDLALVCSALAETINTRITARQ
ncbi:Imm10 family immunity protein [Chitinilyticum piscinae]|uniref:Immunity protein 10 n=1 Tax=Chitinilyticum piscinae TaxID=2866724 RepID=A0A8J7FYF2_9NEIS|nr:Imm10 family immunity protein [Chitinilyticum piscinae]MBE9608003.1 hypothetical protein [Chitinilyticum piscinae]